MVVFQFGITRVRALVLCSYSCITKGRETTEQTPGDLYILLNPVPLWKRARRLLKADPRRECH